MWATGEHNTEMGKRFGYERREFGRIVTGEIEKPHHLVDFVRTLQRLEAQFEDKLKALGEGKIDVVYFKSDPRFGDQWISRDLTEIKGKGRRKALAALGVSRQGLPGITPKKNVVPAYHGTGGLGYIKDRPGRPASGSSELRGAD